jgi:hypothetical protein
MLAQIFGWRLVASLILVLGAVSISESQNPALDMFHKIYRSRGNGYVGLFLNELLKTY